MKQYLISLLAASIICAIINELMEKKGVCGSLIRMITGLLISVTMLSPLLDWELGNYEGSFGWITEDAEAAASYGENMAHDSLRQVIKEQTEAYILDKAVFWGLNLSVEVTLNDEYPPVPGSVELRGAASPHARKQLSQWISDELAIAEDKQLWR